MLRAQALKLQALNIVNMIKKQHLTLSSSTMLSAVLCFMGSSEILLIVYDQGNKCGDYDDYNNDPKV